MTHFSDKTSVAPYDSGDYRAESEDSSNRSSPKRLRFGIDEDEENIDRLTVPSNRQCLAYNTVKCPIAEYGCLQAVNYTHLSEHFFSETHQQSLKRAVEAFIKQVHRVPLANVAASNNEENMSAVIESLETVAGGISSLNDDNSIIHKHIVQLQSKVLEQQNQIDRCKNSIEETIPMMSAMQLNTNTLQNDIDDIRDKMTELSFQTSNDGTFVWKITNVAQKIKDSVAEKQISVYSPSFCSSPTGYKMCMRLYFNGDGQARRTHISLFFVIVRGDYDAILAWPFSQKITFFLYDQSGKQRHIVDSFRPDMKSTSFQRPTSNMNIASGIPRFCPISMIMQADNPYVRDDCMFIKCVVDFASTPKSLNSFICNLNVGLPIRIQHQMIQTEIERLKAEENKQS